MEAENEMTKTVITIAHAHHTIEGLLKAISDQLLKQNADYLLPNEQLDSLIGMLVMRSYRCHISKKNTFPITVELTSKSQDDGFAYLQAWKELNKKQAEAK